MMTTAARQFSIGDRCLGWWKDYCHPEQGDAGVRARLRRCRSAAEALTITPAIDLARRLGAARSERDAPSWRLDRALDIARLLAYVSADTPVTLMQLAGYPHFPGDRDTADDGNRPKISETRFKRLLLAQAGEDLLVTLVRTLAQVDGRANIARLSQDVWWWNDRTRARWAFEYYAAGVAAPTSTESEEEIAE